MLRISFLFKIENAIHICLYITFYLSLDPSVDRHTATSTFCVLWIMLLQTWAFRYLFDLCFHFFCVYSQRVAAGLHGNSRFNFLRNCHTDSNYTISHSHQQNIGVPISAHSLRHLTFLSFFLFLIEDSLMSMKVVSECCFNSCFPND